MVAWQVRCITAILMFQLNVLQIATQGCLQPASNESIPILVQNLGYRRLYIGNLGVQAIITSYQFHCCGNVTAWQTSFVKNIQRLVSYRITFQVWRPSPTMNRDGCYGLVGQNAFSNTLQSHSLVTEYTPEPTNIITVQPGDVVGFFAETRLGMIRAAGIQLDTSFTGESVWYHRNTRDNPLIIRGNQALCPYPVGSDSDKSLRSSTNAALILSADVSTFSCPPSSSITTPKPPSPMQRTSASPLLLTPTPTSTPVSTRTPQPIKPVKTTPQQVITPSNNVKTKAQQNVTHTREPGSRLSRESRGLIGAAGGFFVLVISVVIICTAILLIRRKAERTNITLKTKDLIVTSKESDTLNTMKMQKNASYISTHIPLTANEAYATAVPLSPNQTLINASQEVYSYIDEEESARIRMEAYGLKHYKNEEEDYI